MCDLNVTCDSGLDTLASKGIFGKTKKKVICTVLETILYIGDAFKVFFFP